MKRSEKKRKKKKRQSIHLKSNTFVEHVCLDMTVFEFVCVKVYFESITLVFKFMLGSCIIFVTNLKFHARQPLRMGKIDLDFINGNILMLTSVLYWSICSTSNAFSVHRAYESKASICWLQFLSLFVSRFPCRKKITQEVATLLCFIYGQI